MTALVVCYQICHRPEFCHLHSKDLDRFLSSNDLVVHSEMDVHRALVRWTNHDPVGRKDDFTRMFLRHIRLEFFRPMDLQVGGLSSFFFVTSRHIDQESQMTDVIHFNLLSLPTTGYY